MKSLQVIVALVAPLLLSSCHRIVDTDGLGEPPVFDYTPSNFDPEPLRPSSPVVLDCGESIFDSSQESIDNGDAFREWCAGQPMPIPQVAQQQRGKNAVVLAMDGLHISENTTLELIGNRPIILVVSGTARIEGTIDASATDMRAGPGGSQMAQCENEGQGGTGETNGARGGGGGGGGFGTAGAAGSSGRDQTTAAQGGVAGPLSGDERLVPLRGGCSGGHGGAGDIGLGAAGGESGGAIQISAFAVEIAETGRVGAAGSGGEAGTNSDGGGGGGSGGGILLEALDITISDEAVVSANGGGGGGGGVRNPEMEMAGDDGTPGTIDSDEPAQGGAGGSSTGQNGGAGGTGANVPLRGSEERADGGGGGGGGAAGRVRLNAFTSCSIDELAVLSAVVTGGEECAAAVGQISSRSRSSGSEAEPEPN